MKRIVFLVLLVVIACSCSFAQDKSLFEKHWFIQSSDTLPYRILLPDQYDASKTYPMILFLHGRGESGVDNEKQLTHGAKLFLTDSIRKKFPAIVVFPQCASTDYWANVQMVSEGTKTGKRTFYFVEDGAPTKDLQLTISLVENLFRRYPINKTQVYVMGLSMGGMGTYEIVRRMPKTFAAAVPICGGANPATAKQLRKTQWWIFHGAKDDVVLPEFSINMKDALEKQRAAVRFTLYPNANHNSWDPAFAEPGLMEWLFAQKRK